MRVLSDYYPEIALTDIVRFATLNGAKALGIDNQLGAISVGKKPGLVLIDNIDFEKMRLTSRSTSKRLV